MLEAGGHSKKKVQNTFGVEGVGWCGWDKQVHMEEWDKGRQDHIVKCLECCLRDLALCSRHWKPLKI